MKKFLVLLIAMIAYGSASFAQKGQSEAGVYFNYGTEMNIGLGVKYRYSFTDNWRIESAFNYFFKHDYVSMWDLGANVHYLFPVAEAIKIYPLAGLHYANATAHVKDLGADKNESDGKLGVNVGVGADFKVAPSLAIDVEAKYQIISDFDQFVISAGITYSF